MAKKVLQKPYDPQISPERAVLAAKNALVDENRGTNRILRAGEQYIMNCSCGETGVSSSETMVSEFFREHFTVH